MPLPKSTARYLEALFRLSFRRRAGRLLRQENGSALVEFAVVAPLFILLLFGIIDFSRAIWTRNTAAHAAREGVRYAIVRGAESGRAATESDVEAYVQSRAHGMPTTDVGVTTTWKPDNKPGSVVEVRVEIPFRPILPMLHDMNLTSTSQMVISF